MSIEDIIKDGIKNRKTLGEILDEAKLVVSSDAYEVLRVPGVGTYVEDRDRALLRFLSNVVTERTLLTEKTSNLIAADLTDEQCIKMKVSKSVIEMNGRKFYGFGFGRPCSFSRLVD